MKLTEPQIKELIDKGEVGAISVDTSTCDRHGRRLEAGLLSRLEQFRGSGRRVVISGVVAREVLGHLVRAAREAQTKAHGSIQEFEAAWGADLGAAKAALEAAEGGKTANTASEERLDRFFNKIGAQVIGTDQVAISELLRRYFDVVPPFESAEAKKHEFPDAIALLALEEWAAREKTKMLVVSGDKGWLRFCEASDHLIGIDNLAPALGLFQQEAVAHEARLVARAVGAGDAIGLADAVQAALDDQSWKITFHVEASSQFYYEEEIDKITVKEIGREALADEDELVAVAADEEVLVLSVTVSTLYAVECSFSFQHWDSVDKEYTPMGSGSGTQEEWMDVEVEITLHKEGRNYVVDGVEVTPTSATLEFGEVEPDWMSNPDNYD